MYRSTKTYPHSLGLSACFRQWRAESHCRLLHGYALSFTFVFESVDLDSRNWVVDFGALDHLKDMLRNTFDHSLLVAVDDPAFEDLMELSEKGLAKCVAVTTVGCEAFAKLGFHYAEEAIVTQRKRVRVISCEVKEHEANSAIYIQSP